MDTTVMQPASEPRRLTLALASALLGSLGSALTFVLVLALAVRGVLSSSAASVLAPASYVALIGCVWASARALGVVSPERPLHRRHGFWLLVLLSLLGLPRLGGFGLLDPWETHYAEVAREMSARRDFISPWWAHEAWFMSKPVLSLWLEAAAMQLLGVQVEPGHVLSGASGGFAHPEWAARLPGALFMQAGGYLSYKGVAAAAGRWAGFFGAVVLGTSAQWALVSRQALTDTPFVGALVAAFGLLLLAWSTPETARSARYELSVGPRKVALNASWLLTAGILCAVLPQLALLLSRPLNAGSPGNCGLPSQPACAPVPVAHAWLSPALQAAVWSLLLVPLVLSTARETRARRLSLLGAWCLAAVAAMSKGLAGLALPLGVAGVHLVLGGRSRELRQSELLRGSALVVLLVAPWYVAMFARHGRVIFDELVLRHMLGRTLDHLHDTNAGIDVSFRYYVWQLGYALFPWVGLVPAALASASAGRAERPEGVQRVLDLSLLWLVLTFSLFTFMRTKFHHYILPATPPLAVLVGIWLAERWSTPKEPDRQRAAVAQVLALGGALLVLAVGLDLLLAPQGGVVGSARLLHLFTYKYDRAWPPDVDFTFTLAVFTLACASLGLAFGLARWRRQLVAAQTLVAVAFAAWLGQSYLVRVAPHFGQRHVIEAFYRARSSPAEPLIAYQLNWKGENFYTGNHLAIFVKSGKRMRNYLRERRASGESVFHFVLESSRLPGLRRELGPVRDLTVLTNRHASDKYVLVRAELL